MPETENEVMTNAQNDDAILPDGWTEDTDIFADDYGITEDQYHDPALDEGDATTPAEETDAAPATEPAEETAEGDSETETAPATEPEENVITEKPKLKFRYKYDREEHEAEVDESELPDIYERAQATDRYKAKLGRYSATVDSAGKLAAAMGYDSADEMLQAAANNYRQTLIQELLDAGTPQVIAEDYVNRKMGELSFAAGEQSAQTPDPVAAQESPMPERDFVKEAGDLIAVRPELRGKNLPEEVTNDAITNGKSLLRAYLEYEAKQRTAENDTLRKENKILKQNAEAASRAPVTGTSGGGATNTKADDPFLKGFNEDYY